MKKFAFVMCLVVIAGGFAVAAEKPTMAPLKNLKRVPCQMTVVTHDWDFALGDQGFTTATCDGTGGAEVWQYGTESVIGGAPGDVWATILNGNYPASSGQGLLSPAFTVNAAADKLEIMHYVHIETNYDGANMTINDMVESPYGGYPATINTSASFYAYCVDNEPGFTGNGGSGASEVWTQQCWDLAPYDGQTIQVRFDFGSDSSVQYPGWYLAYVKVGEGLIPVELQQFIVE